MHREPSSPSSKPKIISSPSNRWLPACPVCDRRIRVRRRRQANETFATAQRLAAIIATRGGTRYSCLPRAVLGQRIPLRPGVQRVDEQQCAEFGAAPFQFLQADVFADIVEFSLGDDSAVVVLPV